MNEFELSAQRLEVALAKAFAQKKNLERIGLDPGIPSFLIDAINDFMPRLRQDAVLSQHFFDQVRREESGAVKSRGHYFLDRLSRAIDDPVGDVSLVRETLANHNSLGIGVVKRMQEALTAICRVADRVVRPTLMTEADQMLRKPRKTAHADGHFGPDGFYLDGKLVTGLTNNELALLKLALGKQPNGPTENDVCKLTEFTSWTRARIDKLINVIKSKFLSGKCRRVLLWANRHLVFREPRPRAKKARKAVAKTSGRKAVRKPGESLQKAGRHRSRR